MQTRPLVLAAATSIVLLVLTASAPAQSQQPGVFEVFLPGSALDLEIPDSGGWTLREALGTITGYADGERCLSLNVAMGEGDAILRFGATGQPEVCSKDGAIVTFEEGNGRQLNTTVMLRLGTRETLESFAAPVTFDIAIPLDLLDQPIGFNDPVIKDLGDLAGGFTAYADGIRCVREDAAGRDRDLTLRLGLPDQAAACSREGALVTIVDDYCRQLATEFTLVLDATVKLENLAPVPPGATPHGCEPGAPSATHSPTESASSSTIRPPSTGSAGLLDR